MKTALPIFPATTHPLNKYFLSMQLRAVQVGDAARHLSTGRHGHQAVTFRTGAASIRNHFGAQHLLAKEFLLAKGFHAA